MSNIYKNGPFSGRHVQKQRRNPAGRRKQGLGIQTLSVHIINNDMNISIHIDINIHIETNMNTDIHMNIEHYIGYYTLLMPY